MVGLLVAAAVSERRDCTCGMRHWSDQMEQKTVHHGFSPVPGEDVAYRMFQVIERTGRLAAVDVLGSASRKTGSRAEMSILPVVCCADRSWL